VLIVMISSYDKGQFPSPPL